MPKKPSGPQNTQRVQMLLSSELLVRLDAEAEKQGMNRSEFMRLALEEKLSSNASVEGVDATMRLLRKLLQDELNPQINRLAKMIYKSTKAGAHGLFFQMLAINSLHNNIDAVKHYQDAEKQAIAYASAKEKD